MSRISHLSLRNRVPSPHADVPMPMSSSATGGQTPSRARISVKPPPLRTNPHVAARFAMRWRAIAANNALSQRRVRRAIAPEPPALWQRGDTAATCSTRLNYWPASDAICPVRGAAKSLAHEERQSLAPRRAEAGQLQAGAGLPVRMFRNIA
jgi:hypothetical protein